MKHSTIESHTRTFRQAAKSGQETNAGTVHGEPSKMTVYGPAGQETAGAALTFLNDFQAAMLDAQAIENVVEALTEPATPAPESEVVEE